MSEVKAFKGLNNVSDPLDLGLEWQTQADNADVTREMKLLRCRGYARSTTAVSTMRGMYATDDLQRLYVVDGLSLASINLDFTASTLATLTGTGQMYFAEQNGNVFCTNGTDYLVISPDNTVTTWGVNQPAPPTVAAGSGSLPIGTYQVVTTLVAADSRESANSEVSVIELTSVGSIVITAIQQTAGYTTNVYVTQCDGTVFYQLVARAGVSASYNCDPESLGVELPFYNTNGPSGMMPCFFKGQVYTAESFPQLDASVVWSSLPLQYHQFDASSEGMAVPGTVSMLVASDTHLIIGTDRQIWAWDGERLTLLADYGVVAGDCSDRMGPDVYMWTKRGLCKAMPFVNLTEGTISVAPGLSAAATVMQRDGHLRFIVALGKGGTAYNAY